MSPVKQRHNGLEVRGKLFVDGGRHRSAHSTASVVTLSADSSSPPAGTNSNAGEYARLQSNSPADIHVNRP